MQLPVILAHGALGPYDELIFLSIAAIFLIFMGISWVKSRNTRPEFGDTEEVQEGQRDLPQKADEQATEPADTPERFRLD
jgi:hypothetical protein